MLAKGLAPILNVSDIPQSIHWFQRLGWEKDWEFGTPPTFASVRSGGYSIFLCQGGQGSRGRGAVAKTFGPDGDQTADKGVWMSIWVDDVNATHSVCLQRGFEITWPPTDMPWGQREMHVRHPDGHILRLSQQIEEDE
jgi:catechol 2,3-dioxygenase-like lactoylglutathione lyase family enzyme